MRETHPELEGECRVRLVYYTADGPWECVGLFRGSVTVPRDGVSRSRKYFGGVNPYPWVSSGMICVVLTFARNS